MRVWIGAARVFGAAALLTGCGGGADGRTVVKGKLVEKDKPFVIDLANAKAGPGGKGVPPGTRPIVMAFYPAEGGDPVGANVDAATGTFEVGGPDGKGIKPGRYKIAVTGPPGGTDPFGGKFTPDKTKIVRDITAGAEVVIDVSRPEG